MRFRSKVIYYIITQTAQASVKLVKQKMKRNPSAIAAYFAATMLGDLVMPNRKRLALRRSK